MMIYQFINFFCRFLILVHSEKKKLVKKIVIKKKKKKKEKEREKKRKRKMVSKVKLVLENSLERVSGAIRELILNNTKQYERIQSNQ